MRRILLSWPWRWSARWAWSSWRTASGPLGADRAAAAAPAAGRGAHLRPGARAARRRRRPARRPSTVAEGTLDEVTLTDADGKAVPGEFNAERTSWSSTERARLRRPYTWAGRATGTDGQAVPLAGSFGTVTPKKVVRGTLNIGDDRTVGVAAPIRIQFNGHVVDRAAVERALSVTTSVPVGGRLGLAARRGRRLAGGLPAQGVLAGQHRGHRAGQAVRRGLRRRARTGRRTSPPASPSAGPRSSRPT